MELVVISLLVFLILAIKAFKKRRILFFALLCCYITSFAATLILNNYEKQTNILFIPSLYLLFLLLMWLIPFAKTPRFLFINLTPSKTLRIKKLMSFLGSFSTLALFYFSFYAFRLFFNYDLFEARDIIREETVLPLGFVSLFFISFSTIYYIYIYFFFLAIQNNFSKRYSILMFLSSLSYPVMVLCFFGRDGVLFWMMNFIIMYFFFSNSLSVERKKKIKRAFLSFGFFFIFIFLLITATRFGGSSKGITHSIVSYMGQQYENFSDSFYLKGQGGSIIPTFDSFLQKVGLASKVDRETYIYFEKRIRGEEYNVFSFFIGTFMNKIGVIGTLLISVLCSFFSYRIARKYAKYAKVETFIVLYTLFQIPMCGVFYYRQGVSYMDIGFFLTLFIYIYISHISKMKNY